MKFKHTKVINNPSSLVLDVILWNNFGRSFQEKGIIDTGADRTVIPDHLVSTLDLKNTREISVEGVTGVRKNYSMHFINIQIGDIEFDDLEVIAIPGTEVILGRDLINLWNLKIDGKSETYTIEPWSTNPDDIYK